MNCRNHWLSNTLTRRMAPAISEILTENSRRTLRESSISSWQANGELNVSCLDSAKHSCNVVFSSKKVTWILRYTESILGDRKSSVLGGFSRTILRVKAGSSSMIYGITWCLKHRKEPNVRDLCFNRSKSSQDTSADFKVKFSNGIPGLQFWIVAKVRYHRCCQHVDCLFKYNFRLTNVTWEPWTNE